ncbi:MULTISPECIES: hypothetical protein [unclassified Streptomyces]|uniref:hypothetical protein n=1 Tax=unclassified Streptomyces TaxID=2593676 RepID=UPI00342F9B5C
MSAPTATTRPSGGTAANAEEAGRRVEEIIDHLTSEDSEAARAAEELVRVLMDFYGTGLARMVALLGALEAEGDPFAAMLDDELVTSLLVLHDLHPEDTAARIDRALASVRRRHPVELVSFDDASGTLHLRSAEGSGCGCASTAGEARQAVEDALACFAPEVTSVDIQQAASSQELPLLQISRPPSLSSDSGPTSAKAP